MAIINGIVTMSFRVATSHLQTHYDWVRYNIAESFYDEICVKLCLRPGNKKECEFSWKKEIIYNDTGYNYVKEFQVRCKKARISEDCGTKLDAERINLHFDQKVKKELGAILPVRRVILDGKCGNDRFSRKSRVR